MPRKSLSRGCSFGDIEFSWSKMAWLCLPFTQGISSGDRFPRHHQQAPLAIPHKKSIWPREWQPLRSAAHAEPTTSSLGATTLLRIDERCSKRFSCASAPEGRAKLVTFSVRSSFATLPKSRIPSCIDAADLDGHPSLVLVSLALCIH